MVRIRRSHRRGRGSIPRTGTFFFPIASHILGPSKPLCASNSHHPRGSIPRRGGFFFWAITAHFMHTVLLLLFLFSSFPSYSFSISSSSSSSSSSHPPLPPRIAAVGIPRSHHYRCRRCEKGLHRPGIEPGPPAVCSCSQWQASILPLNHRCT